MNRHEFDILLQKYLAGECSEEEAIQIELWSENMLTQSKLNFHSISKDKLRKRMWKRLSAQVLGNDGFWRKLFLFRHGIAASILLLGLIGFWVGSFYYNRKDGPLEGNGLNSIGKELASDMELISFMSREGAQNITLSDGSEIMLGKNTRIRYPKQFESSVREVYLEGEAFFKVKRDEKKPFLVYSGGIVTKVLGTSFNIRSSAPGQIEVEVVSGSVSVYRQESRNTIAIEPVVLTPNQKIVFEKSTRKLIPELVDAPVIPAIYEDSTQFVFEGSSLPVVLAELSKTFEVEILLDSPALAPCEFTGDLYGLPLHLQLQLICRSVNGTYEQNGNVYVIRGQGCRL